MKVKLLHDCQYGKEGDETDMPKNRAMMLIARNLAQLMPPEPSAEKVEKPKAKD